MLDFYNARTVDVQLKRTLKFAGAISCGLFLSVLLEPTSAFKWGLAVGAVISMVNTFLMYNRLKRIADMPIKQAIVFMRMGFVMRLILIMAVLYLSLNVEGLDIYGVAFGIFIAPMVTVADFNISLIKDYKAHHTLKDKN